MRDGTVPAVATGRELGGRRTTEQYLSVKRRKNLRDNAIGKPFGLGFVPAPLVTGAVLPAGADGRPHDLAAPWGAR